jgi:hypothetical protein
VSVPNSGMAVTDVRTMLRADCACLVSSPDPPICRRSWMLVRATASINGCVRFGKRRAYWRPGAVTLERNKSARKGTAEKTGRLRYAKPQPPRYNAS